MKVLIAGAHGFIGQNVYKYLSENTDWELSTIIPRYNLAYGLELCRDNYDIFLNFASISSVDQSIKNPVSVIENNVMLMTNLLESARKYRPKLFIQFSTIEAQNITSPYAASKKAQEDICLAYSRIYGIPVVVLQSTNVIGPGQKPEKFIPKIIEQIKNGETVAIYTTNGNAGERKYNPVKNVANTIMHLIQENSFSGYTTYEIKGGEKLNNLHIAKLVASLMEKPLYTDFIEANSVRPSYLLDYYIEKRHEYPCEPIQTLEEGLKELL
ncbi:MAG TPA: hypothetical protein DD730_03380 [Desulfosporosinus sp.]|jgi:dTDP-glucose 4,6-dehydratase|nr:hypothetical protein [Desulfosporosinus sp.]